MWGCRVVGALRFHGINRQSSSFNAGFIARSKAVSSPGKVLVVTVVRAVVVVGKKSCVVYVLKLFPSLTESHTEDVCMGESRGGEALDQGLDVLVP